MNRKRNFGKLAALGGLTAAAALLTGLGDARADELADLRANQQLLQQRIDQLAQAQAQAPQLPLPGAGAAMGISGMHAVPGVPAGGGSFPRSFLIPGTNTSIRVGGFVDITVLDFLNGGGTVDGSNYGTNAGQNGNVNSMPVGGGFIPGLGFVNPNAVNIAPSRNNGVFEMSPQQSRLDIETRTPTSWGEARTFMAFDWAGCDNFSCQSVVQGGGDSIHPRLRFAYGTLGGFLAGQALSNFSDADADVESMQFGAVIGGTGGRRTPQVRYTIPGPYGSAFSVSAEDPATTVATPSGIQSSDLALSGAGTSTTPPENLTPAICNGVACTGINTTGQSGTAATALVQANPTVAKAPNLTVASYWAQPWGHVDFAGELKFYQLQDGTYLNQKFTGYGGHVAGDVHPGWFGYNKDDILFSFIYGSALGLDASGGLSAFVPLASNFTVTTACANPIPGRCTGQFSASNILTQTVPAWSTQWGVQHWWLPNLRSTIAAGAARQDVSGTLIGPVQAQSINRIEWNTFVNLVWNPVAFITTGVEYVYGQRIVVGGLTGHEHVLVYKFRAAF